LGPGWHHHGGCFHQGCQGCTSLQYGRISSTLDV
jgi:hypothetical protein